MSAAEDLECWIAEKSRDDPTFAARVRADREETAKHWSPDVDISYMSEEHQAIFHRVWKEQGKVKRSEAELERLQKESDAVWERVHEAHRTGRRMVVSEHTEYDPSSGRCFGRVPFPSMSSTLHVGQNLLVSLATAAEPKLIILSSENCSSTS